MLKAQWGFTWGPWGFERNANMFIIYYYLLYLPLLQSCMMWSVFSNIPSSYLSSIFPSKCKCKVYQHCFFSFLLFFFQDASLLVHSSENVSLNARNENGDVTGRISVGKSLKGDTCAHRNTWSTHASQSIRLMYEGNSKVIHLLVLQQFLIQH